MKRTNYLQILCNRVLFVNYYRLPIYMDGVKHEKQSYKALRNTESYKKEETKRWRRRETIPEKLKTLCASIQKKRKE